MSLDAYTASFYKSGLFQTKCLRYVYFLEDFTEIINSIRI